MNRTSNIASRNWRRKSVSPPAQAVGSCARQRRTSEGRVEAAKYGRNQEHFMSVSSYRRTVSECRPLVDAATKEIFRNNAFRITGLPVDATAGEISRRADKLKVMEDLGAGHSLHKSPFSLRPPPTVDQIRDAIQRLQDPEKRMIDEFFWFWPEEFGRSRMDPAIQALLSGDCDTASKIWTLRESSHSSGTVATHNIAIFWHFTALEREHYTTSADSGEAQEVIAEAHWRNAIKRWRYLLGDKALWDVLDARIRQLNEPRLSKEFGTRMRSAMPLALAKIHGQIALTYVERRRVDLARIQVDLLKQLAPKAEVVEMAADLVLDTAKRRLKSHSQNVKDEAARSPERAATLARTLIAPTLLLFEVIDLFFGDAEYFGKDLLNETLTVCVECAVTYQRKTGDNDAFVDLLERLRPLSDNIELTARISENLRIGKKNLEIELEKKGRASNA
ncbi:MAG: hypothetical protein WCK17_15575, partial [Verrucomicrobiota bacterium]